MAKKMSEVSKQLIDYLTEKVEVVLPDQMEKASEVLGRISLKYNGQMTLFEEEQ